MEEAWEAGGSISGLLLSPTEFTCRRERLREDGMDYGGVGRMDRSAFLVLLTVNNE